MPQNSSVNVNSTFVLVCFLHVQVMISPQQAKPRQGHHHHKKCVGTPQNGVLFKRDKEWIWERYGVHCSLRVRKGEQHLSLQGNQTNFDEAEACALSFMMARIRIDVCKCMSFQSEQIRINKK